MNNYWMGTPLERCDTLDLWTACALGSKKLKAAAHIELNRREQAIKDKDKEAEALHERTRQWLQQQQKGGTQ